MPDFGIMRGFNDKLFGDKLYAGQLPMKLGLIGSSDFKFDSDAQAFFDRVTAAGGSLSATEKFAIDTLVRQIKLDGIWSLMKAIYPMVGASAAACAQNLKSSSFTGTFTSGWTFASTGVTPNGTSAYMNTSVVPNVDLSLNSSHLSFYSRTNQSGTNWDIGSTVGSGATEAGVHMLLNFGGKFYPRVFDGNSGISNTNTVAFFMANRQNSTTIKAIKNSTSTTITSSVVTASVNSYEIPIGCLNFTGIFTYYSSKQCAFASIGDGLTDTQASNFYTAVQAFQTTLGRQV
jgi:hypothetical protein